MTSTIEGNNFVGSLEATVEEGDPHSGLKTLIVGSRMLWVASFSNLIQVISFDEEACCLSPTVKFLYIQVILAIIRRMPTCSGRLFPFVRLQPHVHAHPHTHIHIHSETLGCARRRMIHAIHSLSYSLQKCLLY
jgi:hypothetical protein